MEQTNDYKQEIANTRKGCLGSSDAKILAQIAALGSIPKSAMKRLAVCKGLIEHQEIPKNAAILAGDKIEMAIFDHLSAKDHRYESNALWVSKKYSKKNVKLIAHPDIILKDDARKVLFVYEVKTTKFSINETRNTYGAQLYEEYALAKEVASSIGKDWSVSLSLAHYDTNGLNLEDDFEFEPSRLTVREVRFTNNGMFDIDEAMTIVNDFLETFTEYYDGDEVDANLLPATVKNEFDDIATMLIEIKTREAKVEEFKKRLYQFMVEKNIKSIKNDAFSITRVDPTESKSFDAKKYMEDFAKEHPRKANKILAKYTKTTKRKGYANIKTKDNKE